MGTSNPDVVDPEEMSLVYAVVLGLVEVDRYAVGINTVC